MTISSCADDLTAIFDELCGLNWTDMPSAFGDWGHGVKGPNLQTSVPTGNCQHGGVC
jgi:hypothetical protein